MIKVKTPGKLYLAGEYAVVKSGNSALVMAVDKFIYVEISKATSQGQVESFSGEKMSWTRQDSSIVTNQELGKFNYIFSAIDIAEKFLLDQGYDLDYYSIKVNSQLESDQGIKYGLGSSAAVVVGVIRAILIYYKYKYSKLELFKLSALASILISPQTSCGDIGAAVYTGVIKYRSFSRQSILEKYQSDNIKDLIDQDWDLLEIKSLPISKEMEILVGWTNSPASSENLVKKSMDKIDENKEFFQRFLLESDACVNNIGQAYVNNDFDLLKSNIEKNRKLLRQYGQVFGIQIEDQRLENLIGIALEEGFAAKTSGAGGGDCAIAIGNASIDRQKLIDKWKSNGIIKLDLKIYEDKYE